jgi:hypothetical protein
LSLTRRLEQHGYSAGAALGLLALAAAVLPTEVGAHPGSEPVRTLAAIVAAAVAVSIVPFAVSIVAVPPDARLVVAATASAGAAAIHFAVLSEHIDEYWLFGLFFFGSGVAQLVWAAAVVVRPERAVVAVGALGNAAIIVLWVVSRTAGLPLGPEAGSPEAVGVADVAATALEGMILLTTVWYLARPTVRRPASSAFTLIVAVWAAVIVAVALADHASAGHDHGHDSGGHEHPHHR